MTYSKAILTIIAAAAANAGVSAVAAPLAKQLTIDSGSGVSFQLGKQVGTAAFAQQGGACGLSVAIAAAPTSDGMSGMSGMGGDLAMATSKLASTLKVKVMPGQPAVLTTPEGQELVFNCGPDAKKMFLDIPDDLKYSAK